MPLVRNEDGIWSIRFEEDEQSGVEESHPAYLEALPRYLTALDPAFTRACERCEFEFLLSMIRFRGIQDAGWDPYETTVRAIPALLKVHRQIEEQMKAEGFEAARHLQLWIYGHILEASEPYEILANLIAVARGERFSIQHFPPNTRGRPRNPGEKIERIEREATAAGIPQVAIPLRETWDRDFRNAIFHSDYALYGGETRTVRPIKSYTHEEVMTFVNRALAYHDALEALYKGAIGSYTAPVVIDVHPNFSNDPEERAVVIVREGYGAIGVKDAWTPAQRARGKIHFRVGRFTPTEIRLLDGDPTLALLPREPVPDTH